VRREIGLKPSQRGGQFMSVEQTQRLIDAASAAMRNVVAEYEIGVDYDASDYSSSDVSFNARIFRVGATNDDIQDADDALAYFAERGVGPRGFNAGEWFAASGFTEADARSVLFDLAHSGVVPSGYVVESVDWLRRKRTSVREWQERRKRGAGRDGDEDDLFAFRNIIRDVGVGGIRIGAVKRDKL
jgi:hypothetical protein